MLFTLINVLGFHALFLLYAPLGYFYGFSSSTGSSMGISISKSALSSIFLTSKSPLRLSISIDDFSGT